MKTALAVARSDLSFFMQMRKFSNTSSHLQPARFSRNINILNSSDNTLSPIAVLIGWGNGRFKNLAKYAQIFEKRDCATVCLTTSLVKTYLAPTTMSRVYSNDVFNALDKLTSLNRNRPIFFMAFSQTGSNVMSAISNQLEGKFADKYNVVGSVFDSCPNIVKKENIVLGQRAGDVYLKKFPAFAKYAITTGFNGLFNFHVNYNRPFGNMYNQLLCSSLKAPQLVLFSKDDVMINHRDVMEFAEGRRSRGVSVFSRTWEGCEHVGMYRKHKAEYEEVMGKFIDFCLAKEKQPVDTHEDDSGTDIISKVLSRV